MIDDWLDLAEHLARLEPGWPKQASLRRSVATAYYALFHALADMCVDVTVRRNKPWNVIKHVYRSLDHGTARKYFERPATQRELGTSVAKIGSVFILLQEARHRADYDPEPLPYGRREILDFCAQARLAVETIRSLPGETKLVMGVSLIMKAR
jgi:hypothetical protein